MRSRIIIIGIFLLVIGIGLYVTASIKIEEFQPLPGQIMTCDAYHQYQMFQLMQTMGAVSASAGVIVSIAGATAKSGD